MDFFSPETGLAILSLTLLEIVLGIDNIIFITVLINKLPKALQKKGRIIGLSFAMITRIGLLCSLSWMASLTDPLPFPSLFSYSLSFSGRDLILISGGSFLVYKSLVELFGNQEDKPESNSTTKNQSRHFFWFIMGQIALIDIVFSLDSVITAVGLVNQIPVMVIAIILSVFIMMFALKPISDLLETYPSCKTLALYFLVLVGAVLALEGFNITVPKSFIAIFLGEFILIKFAKEKFKKFNTEAFTK
jgi:predicted tellurium resistance membrane protein TerC